MPSTVGGLSLPHWTREGQLPFLSQSEKVPWDLLSTLSHPHSNWDPSGIVPWQSLLPAALNRQLEQDESITPSKIMQASLPTEMPGAEPRGHFSMKCKSHSFHVVS